ncbi:odorant receptor 22c-like isoform X2 [Solenopsis invicta]|uniref:odorant receptor 22c-like isoform X2 n=1 Tax=Solenopsis invicta TaxID=13686 RepID=UPI00193EBC9F|nr:odorant receptor 22c-like isoform X2 [Solenopsis invicta]
MEYPEENYYKLNRFLLSACGLEPYQSKWNARLIRALITVVMMLSAIFQILCWFTFEFITNEFIVNGVPALLIKLGILSNLHLRIGNVDKVKILFDRISKDWALQKTHSEIKIMREHAEFSKLFTFCCTILSYVSMVGYCIWLCTPEILNLLMPMNESRPRRTPFKDEFFLDEERYVILIRSHTCFVLLTIPLVFVMGFTLFMTLTQHVCGMCKLLGSRAERLFLVVKDRTECDLIQESQIRNENMIVFIQQHYNIIQFVDIIETYHTTLILWDLTAIMIMLSLTIIQILTISDIEGAIRSIGISCATLCQLFVCCYMGQKITDESLSVYEKIYNSTWYNAVVSEQKILLMILIRRCHPLVITASKFYTMSLQNFGKILQTSLSYCMFVRQI